MQSASRSATRRSCSRNARTPPSDDKSPPSVLTTTDLPTGDSDRPGSGSIGSFLAGELGSSCVNRLRNQIIRKISGSCFSCQPAMHNAG